MKNFLTPSRYPNRSSQSDYSALFNLLDQVLVGTFSYQHNCMVKSIPTGFHRNGKSIYVHGSIRSRFLTEMLDSGNVCISVFQLNALVLAESAFEHSVNYRSAIIYSTANSIQDLDEKRKHLTDFTEKFVPDRISSLPEITDRELQTTQLLRFNLDEFSIKSREGYPSNNKRSEVWTGLIEVNKGYNNAVCGPGSEDMEIPQHVKQMLA